MKQQSYGELLPSAPVSQGSLPPLSLPGRKVLRLASHDGWRREQTPGRAETNDVAYIRLAADEQKET